MDLNQPSIETGHSLVVVAPQTRTPQPVEQPRARTLWRTACRTVRCSPCRLNLVSCANARFCGEHARDLPTQLGTLVPAHAGDRGAWAADCFAAMLALGVGATPEGICAVLAVTEQESGFQEDGDGRELPQLALLALQASAAQSGLPRFLFNSLLRKRSSTGRSFRARIESVRTHSELSGICEEMRRTCLGRRLENPVRRRGPMRIRIEFARELAREPVSGAPHDIDALLFTRHWGIRYGAQWLLGYTAAYPSPLYRFADYPIGRYASRNAAFQKALALATGQELPLNGMLTYSPRSGEIGPTEQALRLLAARVRIGQEHVRPALELQGSQRFESSPFYDAAFSSAERALGRPLERALLPQIELQDSLTLGHRVSVESYAHQTYLRYLRFLNA